MDRFAFRRSLAFAWRRFQAETFDKVVRMVIIGHHCPTITTSSCRIQFNNSNSEANDAPHRRVQTSKVRSPRCQGSELGSPPARAYLVSALLTIMRISDPQPLHLTGFHTYARVCALAFASAFGLAMARWRCAQRGARGRGSWVRFRSWFPRSCRCISKIRVWAQLGADTLTLVYVS